MGRTAARVTFAVPALCVVVVVLLTVPSAIASGTPAARAALPHPTAVERRDSLPRTSGGLPGSAGTGPFVNGPAVFRADHQYVGTIAPNATNSPRPTTNSTRPVVPRPPAPPAATGAPRPASTLFGWLTGTIIDSVRGTPVVGAAVLVSAGNCSVCSSGSTNATGVFVVEGNAGPSTLNVSDSGYLNNVSFPTIVAGTTTSIGTMELVHEASVYGTVVGDVAGLPAQPQVSVFSVSRDGNVFGPESNVTASNGSFSLAVDPFPVEVDFDAQAPVGVNVYGINYQDNATWADPSPWQAVDLGTIRLEGNVTLTLRVVDAVTGLGIGGAMVSYCPDRFDLDCFGGHYSSTNGTASFWGVAGSGFADVGAPGYSTNVTRLPTVPRGTGGPVPLGTVDLVPDGAVELTVNFTGGTPNGTWPAALPGGSTSFGIIICSLTGENGALNSGTGIQTLPVGGDCAGGGIAYTGETAVYAAPPLADVVLVTINPLSYPVPPAFPLANEPVGIGVGPPVEMLNTTWANVTPDGLTQLGSVDVSAGTYVSGSINVSGSYATAVNSSATITVCSTSRTSECGPPVTTDDSGQVAPYAAGCPTGPWTFCAPSPPGDVHVAIAWGNSENGTWAYVPFQCCAQEGRPTPLGVFRFSEQIGTVTGQVVAAGDPIGEGPPMNGAAVAVCLANPLAGECFDASVNASGDFRSNAPLGWDDIEASGLGVQPNGTWVDVTGTNDSGVIELAPVAMVGGQVYAQATGAPVNEAAVVACLVVNPAQCRSLPTIQNSNGTYNGTLTDLPFSRNGYSFTASGAGFDSNTVYANVTPGERTLVPPIYLPSIGVNLAPSASPARAANGSTPTTGSWVTGTLVDPRSELAIGGAALTVCYIVSGGGCTPTYEFSQPDGRFNLSTVHGAYAIWINASYYATTHVYVNASVAGTVALGDVNVTPLVQVSGRLVLAPWASLAATDGMGPDQVEIIGCDRQFACGPPMATNDGGFFNVSLPESTADTLECTGGGIDGFGQGYPGFEPFSLGVDASSAYTTVRGSGAYGGFPLRLLGGLTGRLLETGNNSTTVAYFVSYAAVGNASAGPQAGALTGPGGNYTAFLPPGLTGYQIKASAQGLVPVTSPARTTPVPEGLVAAVPPLNLTEFGWFLATVQDAGTEAPVEDASVDVSDLSTGPLVLSGSSVSNGTGTVNVSAPPGDDIVSVGDPLYHDLNVTTTVGSGLVTRFGAIALHELPGGGVVTIRTPYVSTFGEPVVVGAFDNRTDRPVLETVLSESAGPGSSSGTQNGNALGQVLLTGFAANGTNLTISATGYSPISRTTNLPYGASYDLTALNMTAYGVVAGVVEEEPQGLPVPYVPLSVCPLGSPFCQTLVTTNASGGFEVGAPAGYDTIDIDSSQYLANLTRIVNVTPDGFTEIGVVPVFSFGTVSGVVRGLPSGAILDGANLTLCSFLSPPNTCLADESVTTNASGAFTILSPPGQYVFDASAPGYNSTLYGITIAPGAVLTLGVVVLSADGTFVGNVTTATGAPLAGATVIVCGDWSGSDCEGPVATGALGNYTILAEPGRNTVTVVAAGYEDGSARATAVSGLGTQVPPIALAIVPPLVPEVLSGRVTTAANADPLANAFVVAEEDGARVAQTLSTGSGLFALTVEWGTVDLFVGAPGYAPENQTVVAHENVSDLDFALGAMTYEVFGRTTDAASGRALAGVTISNGTDLLATSSANGSYRFALPNETVHLLVASAPVGPVGYASTTVTLVVHGGAVERNVALARATVPFEGVVVDAATGRAIPDASVTAWNGGGADAGHAATTPSGAFGFPLAPGVYTVSVVASGFVPANVTISLGALGNHSAIALLPVSPSASSSTPNGPLPLLALAAGGVLAVFIAAAVLLVAGRRPPPDEASPETETFPGALEGDETSP
jgi:hypothetical protein